MSATGELALVGCFCLFSTFWLSLGVAPSTVSSGNAAELGRICSRT